MWLLELVVGCAQKQSTAELVAYLTKELPIIERHTETVAVINKATEAITSEAKKPATPKDESSASSKTQMEAIEPPKPAVYTPISINQLTTEVILKALATPPPRIAVNISNLSTHHLSRNVL